MVCDSRDGYFVLADLTASWNVSARKTAPDSGLNRHKAIEVLGLQHGLQLLGVDPLGTLDDRFRVG